MACWMTDCEHSLTAKYSHQNASGHWAWPPSPIGVMPGALSFASSATSWATVVGVEVMPALANRSVRYQKPTTCWSYGIPYCCPLTCQPGAALPTSLIQLDTYWVRLASLPDWTCVASPPPP